MNNFSKWVKWCDRNTLSNIKYPGVYCIAVSNYDLSGKDFNLVSDIKYFGMTNAINGLKGRLNQFNNTIIGKTGHGGAERFLFKYRDHDDWKDNIYVSIRPFICDVKTNKIEDLSIMGDVVKFEYTCWVEYIKKFDQLPEFNDKKSKKK